MLTTAGFEPCAVIQSTARTAAVKSVRVVPVHGRMRSAWMRRARATPNVRPARMLATCVPCPRSADGGDRNRQRLRRRRVARPGREVADPVDASVELAMRAAHAGVDQVGVDAGAVAGGMNGRRAEVIAGRCDRGPREPRRAAATASAAHSRSRDRHSRRIRTSATPASGNRSSSAPAGCRARTRCRERPPMSAGCCTSRA